MPLNKSTSNIPLYMRREWLIEKYINEKINMECLAELAGCCYVTLWLWMNKLSIKRRKPGENKKLPPLKHIILTSKIKQFLNGLLLGDGSITKQQGPNRNKTALYEHADKRKEYIIWLKNKFIIMDIKTSPIWFMNNAKAFKFKTANYPELFNIYNQWYQTGKKQIPKTLRLTSVILKNWYIGDGNNSVTPLIDSSLFSLESIARLIKPLDCININYSLKQFRDRIRLRISTQSKESFFNYLLSEDPEIPPGYKYKFLGK